MECWAMRAQNKTGNHSCKSLPASAFQSEADGTRTRNHWIDSHRVALSLICISTIGYGIPLLLT